MTTPNTPQLQNHNQSVAIQQKHDLSIIEQVVMLGDLSKLTAQQRVTYYHAVCESVGLNPLTRPFDYISLNGKLTLYAKKDCTEQLRQVKGISITGLEEKMVGDVFIIKAKAKTKDGRTDEATGAVACGHLKGEAFANAIMKAETKAKRRVTLSIGGLGWTDETEIESIPNAKPVVVDIATGEIVQDVKPPQNLPKPTELVENLPPEPQEPPKPAEIQKAPGYDEFVLKHKLYKDVVAPSFKYAFIEDICKKRNIEVIKIINHAISDEAYFEETYNKWLKANYPDDKNASM